MGDKIENNEVGGAYNKYLGGGVYIVLVGLPEGRTPLGRPRRRWRDNMKIYLQEVGCGVWNGLR